MEYNTERKPLIIPEYGRHMQEMVNYCMAIEDREKRNEFAGIIIEVMGELNPHLRDVDDFQHKLWDQLFIMSEFKLDVDSPFPVPEKAEVYSRPKRIPYPQEEYKYKYYGKNIRRMIDVAISWEGEKQEGLIMVIANHMKKCYLLWNKDTVEDSAIFDHLYEMSDGKIDLRASNEILSSGEKYYSTHSSSGKNRKGKGGKSKKYSR